MIFKWKQFSMPGDTQQCLKTLLGCHNSGKKAVYCCHLMSRDQGCSNHPAMHCQPPTKNCPAQNVNSSKSEKRFFRAVLKNWCCFNFLFIPFMTSDVYFWNLWQWNKILIARKLLSQNSGFIFAVTGFYSRQELKYTKHMLIIILNNENV